MSTHASAVLLALLVITGCGPNVLAGGDDESTGDAPATTASTTSPSTSTTTTPATSTSAGTLDPDPDTSTSGNADTGFDEDDCGQDCCGFLCPPEESGDDFGPYCDVWEQDCPEQEKCMPWANDGGWRWNSPRCSPLAENPGQVGEPCAVEGSAVSGIDDCDRGLMCFYVDPLTNLGTCVANCGGTEANPICEDPSTSCVLDFDGVFNECLPTCDPFLQDCASSGCLAVGESDVEWFACGVPIADPLVADFEPCDHHWVCQTGSLCTTEEMAPSCDDGRCCAPMCDLAMPGSCDEGYACLPVFDEGRLPPNYELFGYCALP